MTQEKAGFSLKAFPHKETKQAVPLTVNAPVIFDAGTEEGVKPLLDFVRSLAHHSNTAVAEKESGRLAGYFSSMSVYLTRALEKDDPEMSGPKKEALKELTTPGGLSGVFNAMAACTRNTLISDVAIMPYNIKNNRKTASLFDYGAFKVGYRHLGHSFDFGFLQVNSGAAHPLNKSSTTFPTFMIDNEMMKAVAPHQPEALLRGLQAVMTFVNHDMLHHFTSPVINAVVADKFKGAPSSELLDNWSRSYEVFGAGYEDWAQIGQERIMLMPENADQINEVSKKLDHYFEELRRIGKALLPEGKQKAHEVADFFGMVMAHALTRVFPLNHPVMAHCLDRLQQADPSPESGLIDYVNEMLPQYYKDKKLSTLMSLREWVKDRHGSRTSDIIESYKKLGFDMLPDNNPEVGYKNLKLLQLIRLCGEDIHPHTPKTDYIAIAKIQETADQATLDMIAAAAKTAGYKPKT